MHRRRSPAVLALLAIVTMLGAWAAAPLTVLADAYDDACASPTTTIGASSTTAIDVTSTSVVLIAAGTFQGGINSWASGGVICIAAPATFQPPYMNNAAGSLFNRGGVVMPGTSVQGGFTFDNFSLADFPNGFNTNGPATLTNHAGATWTMPNGFNTSATFVNDGTATISNGFNQNGGVVQNGGTLTVNGSTNLNGGVLNTGSLDFAGSVNLNSGALLGNACVMRIRNGLNNGSQVLNGGWLELDPGTTWQNNGTFFQGIVGITTGANMTNSGSVTGFGEFSFTGNTVTQGTFSGLSAAQPIVFDDTSPTGSQIFDTQNGVVTNVVAAPVTRTGLADLPFGCGTVPPATADVSVVQAGPAIVAPGGTITYTIVAVNRGPTTATGVVVTEALPPTLGGVAADGGGVIGGGTVTWTVGTLAPGATRIFTVTGTAPASGILVAVVSSTATSVDGRPGNNDGSSPNAIVTTVVDAAPPANLPPVVDDVSLSWIPTSRLTGVVPMSDPDTGQVVTASLTTPPSHGTATVGPDGSFEWVPTGAFTGIDTFVVTGCDNGSPSLCDSGTVTITIAPIPADDTATTTDGVAINVDVAANDLGDTGPPTVVSGPANGTTTVEADGSITYSPTPGFTGTDSFAYEVCSTVSPTICGQATVTIEVGAAPNQPPAVGDATATTTATIPATGSVTVSDPDAGQTVKLSVAIAPGNGVATVDDTGAFTYTPSGTFTGIDEFVVVGCDDGDPILCDSGHVTVTVSPLAVDDAATTTDGVPVDIAVTGNDIGSAGAPTVVSGPANGSATVQPNNSITYAPTPGFTGTDSFVYEICSVAAPTACDQATVTVDVAPTPNQPPVVGNAVATTTATVPAAGSVAVSDPDAGQTVTMTVSVAALNGTATVDDTGAFTYTPTGAFTGTDTFTVQGCDDGAPSLCDTGVVTVTVSPLAGDDAASTTDGVAVNVDVAANDLGDTGPPTVVSGPANGSTTVEADGTITYAPTPGFTGTDTFDYQICSTVSPTVCATATVTVDVAATPNQPPVVGDATATTTATVPATGNVTVSDPDVGQTVTMTVSVAALNGTATVDGTGAFTYTPTGAFTGTDTFTVQGCDDGTPSLCDTGIVTVTVSPLAVDDAASTTDGVPVNVDVAANDLGTAGAPTVVVAPGNGTTTIEGDGTITYSPTPGFTGTDSFDYQICSTVSPTVCAIATVTVDVAAIPNAPPVVGDATASTTATVQATGSVPVSDPDTGQAITMTVTVGGANGTATVDDSGAFTYTPTGMFTGTDTFTVEGCDDGTPSLCDTGTVTVTVSPLAVDDAATTTDGAPVEVDVQANDIGDAGTPTIVTPPTNGTAVIGSIIYTPNAGFVGTDQVTYQVCSPNDQAVCDTAVLTITVTAAAPTPVPTDTPPPTDALRDPFRAVPGGAAMIAACAVLAATIAAAGALAYRRRTRAP